MGNRPTVHIESTPRLFHSCSIKARKQIETIATAIAPTVALWEIEAKVQVNALQKTRWFMPEDSVVSQHRFFYDEDDNYLFSLTDTRKFKQKTDKLVVTVGNVQVMLRKELITAIPKVLPPFAGFRLVTRTRSSCMVNNCLLTFDDCQSGSTHLYQIECESHDKVVTFDEGIQTVKNVAETMLQALAGYTKVDYTGLEKYEWAKLVSVRLPTIRKNKTWFQKLCLQ